VHLRGFGPGKAPRPVLEKLYKSKVEDDVARELIELSLGQAIRDKQIDPVAPPRVDRIDLKSGQPFKFAARVEVRSQVQPKDYAGIPLTRRAPAVTDDQIKEARERRTPALDDELAKDTGEADTLDGLKEKIRGRLLEADKKRIKRELESQVVKELIKRNPFPIAPSLVDRHADSMVNRARM